ncbi:uncharacterized protein METZ01_LOCUS503644 [marine metagenome]|uniref:Uncharacterized protein n=1 Tax=marine metagenome TaxID=408172 RepID=A0A383E2Y4_9ZZZZ
MIDFFSAKHKLLEQHNGEVKNGQAIKYI